MFLFSESTLTTLPKQCADLASLIIEDGYKPDYILYIERAGKIIGQMLSKELNCPYEGVWVLKEKRKFREILRPVLRFLPKNFVSILRSAQKHYRENIQSHKRDVRYAQSNKLAGFKVLIVDDAVDTGSSIKALIQFLESANSDILAVKSAVITTVTKKPLYTPDYSLYKNKCFIFPWSVDSPDYEEYKKLSLDEHF